MPTIEMSPSMFTGGIGSGSKSFTNLLINGTGWDPAFQQGLLSPNGPYGYSFLKIMKGTIPANFTTLVDGNSRSTDILVTFIRSNTAGAGVISVTNTNTATPGFNTSYTNATASGTATWFWMYSPNSGYTPPLITGPQFIGTIGTIGSGADMEVNTTTVVAGVPWRVYSATLQLPTSWTY